MKLSGDSLWSSAQIRNCKKCVVCGIRRLSGSGVFLARIPLDPERSRKWIKAIGEEEFVYIPIEKLHQLKYVCNKHFRVEDLNESRTRLLPHAVPSLNLPRPPLNDLLLQDFPLHINQYPGNVSDQSGEHNYCHVQKPVNHVSAAVSLPSATQIECAAYPVQSKDIKHPLDFEETLPRSCEKETSIILDNDFGNDIECNADEENNENDNDAHVDVTEENFGNDYDSHSNASKEDIGNDNINSNSVEGIEDEFITHRLDEIDSLFLSYAGAFRKLSPNIQTKLKLDIAKLFARYEIKNEIVKKDEKNKHDYYLPVKKDTNKKNKESTNTDKNKLKKEKKIKNYSCFPVKDTSQQQSFQCLKESVSPVEPSIANSNLASWKTSAAKHVNKRKCLSQKSKESVSQDETRCEESAPALDSPTEHDVKRKCLRQPLMATVSKGDTTHNETPAPPLSGLPLVESGGQDDIAPTSGSIDNSASSVIASQDASHIASMPLLSCSSLEPVPCDVDLTSEYLVGTRLLEDKTLEEIDDCGTLEDEMSRDVTS